MNPLIDSRDFETIEARRREALHAPPPPRRREPLRRQRRACRRRRATRRTRTRTRRRTRRRTRTKKDDDEEKKPLEPVEIDFDGLADRYVELPVEAGRYYGLGATAKKLFFLSIPAARASLEEAELVDGEPQPDGTPDGLRLRGEGGEAVHARGSRATTCSRRRDKIAVMKSRGEIYVARRRFACRETTSPRRRSTLGNVVVELDPREEWRADLLRGLAAHARLLLGPEDARRRLDGDARSVRDAAAAPRDARRPRAICSGR